MAVSKNARGWFSEFDLVYSPIVICSERGRIVYKNDIAKRVLGSLKAGSLINKYFEDPSCGENAAGNARTPALCRLREEKGCFREALRFDIDAGDEAYLGYLFDFSFVCLEREDPCGVLDGFGDCRLTVDTDDEFEKEKSNVLFARFCDSLYEKVFSYIENDVPVEAKGAAEKLLASLTELLGQYGCDVSVDSLSFKSANAFVADRTFFIYFAHMLMFYIKLVDPRRMNISVRKHGEFLETALTAGNVKNLPPMSGGMDELARNYPKMRVAAGLMRAVLSARGMELDFEVDGSNIVFCQRQKLIVAERVFLRQETDALEFMSGFFRRVMETFLYGFYGG